MVAFFLCLTQEKKYSELSKLTLTHHTGAGHSELLNFEFKNKLRVC